MKFNRISGDTVSDIVNHQPNQFLKPQATKAQTNAQSILSITGVVLRCSSGRKYVFVSKRPQKSSAKVPTQCHLLCHPDHSTNRIAEIHFYYVITFGQIETTSLDEMPEF